MDQTTRIVRATCLRVLMAALVTGAAAEAMAGQPEPGAAPRTLFRETFTRQRGTPVTETRVISIANFRPPFVLNVQSGDAGINRVSSASVTINGRTVLAPSDFSRSAALPDVRRIPIDLREPSTLIVRLNGSPGSELTLWIDGVKTNDPLTLTLDADRAVSAPIDPASGGTLEAEGSDGTTFALSIPPNATLSQGPWTVAMTPIAAASGLPAPLRFVAGTEFGPSGLQFATPLTLTIPMPVGVDPDRLMAIAYSGAAGDYSFVPLIVDRIQGTLSVPIAHFSSILITEGWIDNCVELGNPQSQEDRYVQAVACVWNHPSLSDEDRQRLLVEIFSEWRLVVVLPAIDLAVILGTLASAENAAAMYQRWHEQQELALVAHLDPLPVLDAAARDMLAGHLAAVMQSLDLMCRVSGNRCEQEGLMQSFLAWAHLAEVNAFPLPIATNEFCDDLLNTIADHVGFLLVEQPLVKHRLVRLEAFATARGSHLPIDSPLTWSTSDPSVLWLEPNVEDHYRLVRPRKEGAAIITVTAGCSASASLPLTVVAPSGPVASVVMYHGDVILANHANVILTEAETVLLSAVAKNAEGDILEGASIIWGSDLTGVAYIGDVVTAPDDDGILQSVAPVHVAGVGDATITASSGGRSATVFVHVTSPPPPDPTGWILKGKLYSYRSNWSYVFNSNTESTESTGEGRSTILRERWSGRLDGASTYLDSWLQSIGMTGAVEHESEETRISSCAQFGTSGGTTVTMTRRTYSPSPSSTDAMAQANPVAFYRLSGVWEDSQGTRVVRYVPPLLRNFRRVWIVEQLRYRCRADGTLGSPSHSVLGSDDSEFTGGLYSPVPFNRIVAVPLDTLHSVAGDELWFVGDSVVGTLAVDLELLEEPAYLTSVETRPADLEIPVGGTADVRMVFNFSDRSSVSGGGTWTSADPSIATVEAPTPGNAVVSGIRTGITTVTAEQEGHRATATVVVGRRLEAIDVIPTSVSFRVGDSIRLEAVFRDNFGGTYPPKPVNWRSSNPLVARVDAFGELFGESFGEADITAESDGLESAPITVIVDSRAVSLRIDPALPRIALGDAAFLRALLTDNRGNTFTDPDTIWSSSHPDVATVESTGEAGIDRAMLTPRSEGTTTITARFESAETTMVVAVYRDLFRVDITPALDVLHVGEHLQLSAIVTDAAGMPFADKPVSWRSTDSSVATVDANGHVAAVAIGFAGMIASADGVDSPTKWIEVVETIATVSTISGHVHYSSTPLAGFTVSLLASGPFDDPIETAQSGADGSFVFGLVPVGQYWLRVDGGGEFIPWTAFGVNASTAETVLNMYLPKIMTLVSPPHGAILDILAGAPALTWMPNAEADAGGRYAIQINASATSALFEVGESAANSYTIQQALQPDVDYTWQVDAYDANHRRVGSTTTAFTFTAGQGAPRRLAAWGDADTGQIGDGFYSYRLAPVPVRALNDAAAISAGDWHNLVATAAGTVWAWGLNDHGQLGFPMTPGTPAQGGFDDRTSLPGQVLDPADATGVLTGVTAVAAGLSFSVALKSDGTVWTWGSNDARQLGNNCAAPFCPSRTTPGAVAGLEDVSVRAIAAGERHALALADDGTVWAWGQNTFGELGDGCEGLACVNRGRAERIADLTGVVAIASGAVHAIALKSDGTVWAWGGTNAGQLGTGCVPDDCFWRSSTPIQVQDLDSVVAIAAGANHNLALRTDGTLWAWGANEFGQLGNRAVGAPSEGLGTPVLVTDAGGTPLSGLSSIAAGRQHSLAIKTDGSAWAWGRNGSGQLGDGTWVNRRHPVRVRDFAGGVLVDGGAQHSLAALTSAVPNAASNQGTLGPQGGAVSTVLAPPLDSLAVTVEIPAGALASDAIISITELATDDPSLPDPPIDSLSRVFQIAPEALTFSAPVDLIFHYDDAELAGRDEASLIVSLLAGGEYVVVNDCGSGVYPCTARRDLVNNTITVRTDRFSTWLLTDGAPVVALDAVPPMVTAEDGGDPSPVVTLMSMVSSDLDDAPGRRFGGLALRRPGRPRRDSSTAARVIEGAERFRLSLAARAMG